MITLLILLAVAAGTVLMVFGIFRIRQDARFEHTYFGRFALVLGLILFVTGSGLSMYLLR